VCGYTALVRCVLALRCGFSSYQRGIYYGSITSFNPLPASIAELAQDKKHFISALKSFLIVEFIYSSNRYFKYRHKINIDDVQEGIINVAFL